MADDASLVASRQRFLLLVVLAPAALARISGAHDRRVALAMAGRSSGGIGIRCRAALHLGLWLDRTRHARPVYPAPATGRSGLLPPRAKPMYLGFAVGWIGLWIVFDLFVVFYEEPTMRNKFGTEYEEYCAKVNRWGPRLQGWNQRQP